MNELLKVRKTKISHVNLSMTRADFEIRIRRWIFLGDLYTSKERYYLREHESPSIKRLTKIMGSTKKDTTI